MLETNWPALHGDSFKGVRVLVTGGAGFIGSHLCDALSSLGANVAVLDDFSGSDGSNIAQLKQIELIRGSILEADSLKRAVNGAKYVFHLGAMVSVPASVADPEGYHRVNTTGTDLLLNASRKARVSRV